ncbi:MAG: hypothetical protein LVR00_08090 [Rhabdochlamydiaceae bacterium]|jgi:WD40 repeat protein
MAGSVNRTGGYFACLFNDEDDEDQESDSVSVSGLGEEPVSPQHSGSIEPISTQTSRLLLQDHRMDAASDYSATVSTVTAATKASQRPLFRRTFQEPETIVYEAAWEKMVSAHRSGIWRIVQLSGTELVTCSYDKTAKVWDMMRGVSRKTIQHKGEVLCAAVSANSFVTGCAKGDICFWDSKTFELKQELKDPNQQGVYSAEFLLGERLATGATQRPKDLPYARKWDHTIKIWSLPKKEVIGRCKGHEGGVSKLICLPDNRLISSSEDGTVRVWHTLQHQQIGAPGEQHKGKIYSMCLMGNSVITGGQDQVLRIWDVESLSVSGCYADNSTRSKKAHDGTIFDVCKVSKNVFASASRDGSIKLWDLRKPGPILNLNPDDGFVYSVCALSDQCLVAGTGGREFISKRREPNLVSWVFAKEGSDNPKKNAAE